MLEEESKRKILELYNENKELKIKLKNLEKNKKIQVSKEHYDFLNYVDGPRWSSYYRQIAEVIQSKASKVLLIGVGDGIVVRILKDIIPDIKIETFDFDEELHPDIVGDVRKLSAYLTSRYDAIVCCQVLEHLKFEKFEKTIHEISLCLKRGGIAIISLPDSGEKLKVQIKFPKIWINRCISLCKFWKKDFQFNGEHYWEINSAAKYHCVRIRKILKKYFKVKNEYKADNNPYHRFFILKKK